MHLYEFFEKDLDEGIHDPYIFKAIFMAGPPGAGKNTVIKRIGLSNAGLKLQDIDKTLYMLKAAGRASPMDYQRGLDATMRRQSVYQKNMLGLLINTTGRDSDSLLALNKQLKTAGYSTFMLYVDVNYDVAMHRIHDREHTATDPADKRPVDMGYFASAYESSKQNLDFYALMFGGEFAMVVNNVHTDETAAHEYERTLAIASKKVGKFLRSPMSAVASNIVKELPKT